ncbi:hypothetical protein P3S67_003985 [Capsicum chacoense]
MMFFLFSVSLLVILVFLLHKAKTSRKTICSHQVLLGYLLLEICIDLIVQNRVFIFGNFHKNMEKYSH